VLTHAGYRRSTVERRSSVAIGVTSMIDIQDVHGVLLLVYLIPDAVLTSPRSPQPFERLSKGCADAIG
jgi:hypothetical protein